MLFYRRMRLPHPFSVRQPHFTGERLHVASPTYHKQLLQPEQYGQCILHPQSFPVLHSGLPFGH